MIIDNITPQDVSAIQQAANLLVESFREHWPNAWPDLPAALEEVREALEPGKICRAAMDVQGRLLGWIGGIPQYDGHVWELHPLVVAGAYQGRGIGRALVADFEVQAKARGGLTVLLGSDDEDGMTSLSGVDLYTNLWERVAAIRNLNGHPYEFYQKCGYTIVGVVPDANGPGKPDIIMAKRLF